MRRLAFFLLIMLAMPAAPQAAGEKVYRLGVLAPSTASLDLTRSFTLPELAKLGFSEGRNLVVDARVGGATVMPALARELLLAQPDAVFTSDIDGARAVHAATSSVPIVTFGHDPVRAGLAASLVRPAGNVTGVVIFAAQLDGKRLDLLHEAVPTARRVAALLKAGWPERQDTERELRGVAARLGLELLPADAAGPEDYPAAFTAMRASGAQALVIMAHPQFYADASRLLTLARETGLPTACEWAEMAHSGCLLGYGPDRAALRRRLAHYVARIFHGAAPGELPIEQPVAFKFAINLKTARALGIEISPSLLARADEVIE
jgi:putative tryptophan/tyrosine transport system substrate-binding protein